MMPQARDSKPAVLRQDSKAWEALLGPWALVLKTYLEAASISKPTSSPIPSHAPLDQGGMRDSGQFVRVISDWTDKWFGACKHVQGGELLIAYVEPLSYMPN